MMKLSKRLERLAGMVTTGNRLADVGTDHGYVPIYLCEKGRIPSAIAMDINEGPLKRAKHHIGEAGLGPYIETRRSDGLSALLAGEADTILIAGMGGPLTVRILEEGRTALSRALELVLQPQSEIGKVRRWLSENRWKIVCEDIVLEEGKYYPMMRAAPGREADLREADYCFGRVKLQRSLPVLTEFLEKQLEVQRQILSRLPQEATERIGARRAKGEEKIRLLQQVLEEIRSL